jgi:hypothetical protein
MATKERAGDPRVGVSPAQELSTAKLDQAREKMSELQVDSLCPYFARIG